MFLYFLRREYTKYAFKAHFEMYNDCFVKVKTHWKMLQKGVGWTSKDIVVHE